MYNVIFSHSYSSLPFFSNFCLCLQKHYYYYCSSGFFFHGSHFHTTTARFMSNFLGLVSPITLETRPTNCPIICMRVQHCHISLILKWFVFILSFTYFSSKYNLNRENDATFRLYVIMERKKILFFVLYHHFIYLINLSCLFTNLWCVCLCRNKYQWVIWI